MIQGIQVQQGTQVQQGIQPQQSVRFQQDVQTQQTKPVVPIQQITGLPLQERMITTPNKPGYNSNTPIQPRAIQSQFAPQMAFAEISASKAAIPQFQGKEEEVVDAWFFALDRYFRKNNTHISLKVDRTVDYLRDGALVTFRSIDNWDSISWDQFRNAFYTTYQPQNLQKVLRKRLSSLKQENTIAKYIEEFNKIMNKIRNMSEEDKIEYFILGLQPETSKEVAFEEPLSLVEAKTLATKVETFFTKSSGFRKEHDEACKLQMEPTLPKR